MTTVGTAKSGRPFRTHVTRDRSLDDFVSGENGERDGSDDADAETRTEAGADAEAKAGEVDAATDDDAEATSSSTDAVEPAVGTYRWDPDGAACAACGETAERLWSDDGEQVCEACKEW